RVMLARVDPERRAERRQQVLFIELRIALHRVLVLDALRDVAQFLNRLALQLLIRVGHRRPPKPGTLPRAEKPIIRVSTGWIDVISGRRAASAGTRMPRPYRR